LTILARKEPTYPIGFQFLRVKSLLPQLQGRPEYPEAVSRLKEASRRGWLGEHPMLKSLAEHPER
jgi:hypothetical protein